MYVEREGERERNYSAKLKGSEKGKQRDDKLAHCMQIFDAAVTISGQNAVNITR